MPTDSFDTANARHVPVAEDFGAGTPSYGMGTNTTSPSWHRRTTFSPYNSQFGGIPERSMPRQWGTGAASADAGSPWPSFSYTPPRPAPSEPTSFSGPATPTRTWSGSSYPSKDDYRMGRNGRYQVILTGSEVHEMRRCSEKKETVRPELMEKLLGDGFDASEKARVSAYIFEPPDSPAAATSSRHGHTRTWTPPGSIHSFTPSEIRAMAKNGAPDDAQWARIAALPQHESDELLKRISDSQGTEEAVSPGMDISVLRQHRNHPERLDSGQRQQLARMPEKQRWKLIEDAFGQTNEDELHIADDEGPSLFGYTVEERNKWLANPWVASKADVERFKALPEADKAWLRIGATGKQEQIYSLLRMRPRSKASIDSSAWKAAATCHPRKEGSTSSQDLKRFVEAQESHLANIGAELAAGRKRTHWMWFAFPQLRGLGRSEMARYYGLSSRAEAAAYLSHPVLGSRLHSWVELLLSIEGRSAHDIFGSPDDLKLRSSLTLFSEAAPGDNVFSQALAKFFDGEGDPATLQLL